MVVEGDGRRVGLCVDELLGQQQVVVKTLEANYGHVEGIAGATILGDGSVALILDIAGLTRSVSEYVGGLTSPPVGRAGRKRELRRIPGTVVPDGVNHMQRAPIQRISAADCGTTGGCPDLT